MIVELQVMNSKHAGKTYMVWKSPYIIGRHEHADLRINNAQVSGYHCCIIIRGTEVWVRDMDSTNGTLVNDERIEGEVRLRVGDVIQAGPAVFEVLQKPTGAIPELDRNLHTPTEAALPPAPPPSGSRRPKPKS